MDPLATARRLEILQRRANWTFGIVALLAVPAGLLFFSVMNVPALVLAVIVLSNWSAAFSSFLLLHYLRRDSLGAGIYVDPVLVTRFFNVLAWGGVHQIVSMPFTLPMAYGFVQMNLSNPDPLLPFLAWGGAAIRITVDGILLGHSALCAYRFRVVKFGKGLSDGRVRA